MNRYQAPVSSVVIALPPLPLLDEDFDRDAAESFDAREQPALHVSPEISWEDIEDLAA